MRTLGQPNAVFAGDHGHPDPELRAILAEAYAGGTNYHRAIAALCTARLLLPIVAAGDEGEPGSGPDPDRHAEMAAVLVQSDAGATAVKMAHDAGIPVVGTNTRANTDLLSSYVGSDDVLSGYLEAKAVLDKIGCKGNVVVIQGPIGISAQIQRSEGNAKALAECPEVKVLEEKTANWSRAEAQALMENWLTRYPGQINGIIGQNDEMALGAIEAVKSQGLNLSDFTIAGIDGITDALLAVKAGEMTSILQDARAQAMGSLDVAAKLADPNYKPQSDVWTQYPEMPFNDGKSANYNVPWTPVTPANVDGLLAFRNK